jgi:hypothetical protein
MMRHVLGEDLKIGANLTWGPCFDYQKQFFTGVDDPVSRWPYLLRYDVEVSGFGSHNSGHLCLLRLRQQMYPGGDSKKHWPTLGLNTLKWAKAQGGLTGPAHSGWGLELDSTELPTQKIPPFSGIGANEYIVDVTHQVPGPDGKLVPAVDFISTVDTPYPWELNIWYHTLNAGYRTRSAVPAIHDGRVHLLLAGTGEHRATTGVEQGLIFQCHHRGGDGIQRCATRGQHQAPGLQGPAQAGVVGRFARRRHGVAQNRAGATVHGQAEGGGSGYVLGHGRPG